MILRFLFSVFQPGFWPKCQRLILFFTLLRFWRCSPPYTAILQRDLKRTLAYSSIGQVGYMLLGIALLSESGLMATMIHLFNHGITKAALFMGVGVYVLNGGGSFYYTLRGRAKTMLWTSAAMVVAGLSLIGVPGTAGFLSKWLLVEAALAQGMWPIALLIVASSLLAVIYVWKLIETLYLAQPTRACKIKTCP